MCAKHRVPTREEDSETIHEALAEYAKLSGAVARRYAERDWHRLTILEREIVKKLEELGFLSVNEPENGFVGKALVVGL